MMDVEDEKNGVIEACIGYAGAIGVMVIDEMANVNEWVWYICSIIIDDNLTNVPQFDGFDMAIGNHQQTLEDHDVVMHSHSNELGAIRLDLRMAIEQVEVQKEMILGLEDVNKHLEEEQDCHAKVCRRQWPR